MPRILPRLLQKIEQQANEEKFFDFKRPKRPPKSLYKSPPSRPSFQPSAHPRSILLSPQNPIVDIKEYARHKRSPPSLLKPGKIDEAHIDPPRQMSREEMDWWANPYLRMLSSPIRSCAATGYRLPSDFLIRLTGLKIPSSSSRLPLSSKDNMKLVPDGLLHPKYVNRRVSGAIYVLCWQKAILYLEKGGYKRMFPQLTLYPQFTRHIAHLLRLRVLQELELLAERLEHAIRVRKNFGASPVLRRLTRDEWGTLRSTGSIPDQNAVAVLIVPPVNRRSKPKRKAFKGSMSAMPPIDEHNLKDLPPTSTLLTTSQSIQEEISDILPLLKVPLYNSISAFPGRSQRIALYSLLMRILTAERFVKRAYGKKTKSSNSDDSPPKSKGSHAFVLCADGTTLKRGDSTAVALALWRLRMYDSEGWEAPPTLRD